MVSIASTSAPAPRSPRPATPRFGGHRRGHATVAAVRRRVLLVQSALTPYGGGEGVCAWILEALRADHHLSLLTWEAPDFAALDAFFGTSLASAGIEVRRARSWLPAPLRRGPTARQLRHWALQAEARLQRDVDLLMAAEEESDLGGHGIQYLHFPRLRYVDPATSAAGPAARRFGHALYRRAAARATGFSLARMRRNVTIVNSDWTGAEVKRLHGIETTTIHPPAVGPFARVAWAEREDGFVAIGRIVPEKRLELIIDIVARVREAARAGAPSTGDLPELPLHIVGGASDPAYEARVTALARAAGPWVHLHRHLSRAALVALLARHRYGIHGMAEEHFGMAVAEMVSAGMIPFVPHGGGQVEIVRDERLLWRSPEEAVQKVIAVRSSPAAQASVRETLAAQVPALGPERFMREIRALVRATLAGGAGSP